MKFSLAASTLGLAALALAAPADVEGRSWGGSSSPPPSGNNQNCGNSQQAVCCDGKNNCYVAQAGGKENSGSVSCANSQSATIKCCQTNSSPGSLINVDLLNCNEIPVDILGGGILS
ncbi:unnamed protein product [Clonostachys solani]|uniref:Hydrophobin n=1 Tax=Clonostachys solani TaxID=160281 RepID=A0A9N9ZEQ0_9HYPO|nr:unnamed protein product [Clonostachys solani]